LRSSGTVQASLPSGFVGGLYRRRISASSTDPSCLRNGLNIFTFRVRPVAGDERMTSTGSFPSRSLRVSPVSRSMLWGATSQGLFSIWIQYSTVAIGHLLVVVLLAVLGRIWIAVEGEPRPARAR